MHVDNISRTRLLMKVVHVLGTDEKALSQRVFKFRESEVGGIRFGFRRNPPTHGIELPNQAGITVPGFGRSDFLDSVVPPKSTRTTKSWDAAFRTHSRSSQNEDAVSGGNGEHG
jgi:hypothetical protein